MGWVRLSSLTSSLLAEEVLLQRKSPGSCPGLEVCFMNRQKKSKRKIALSAREHLPWTEGTAWIVSKTAALQNRISSEQELQRDFGFLRKKLGCPESELLQRVFWDSGRFSSQKPKARPVLSGEIKAWNGNRYYWKSLPKRVFELADEIEKANETKLSPLPMAYQDEEGKSLSRSQQGELREEFVLLPDTLRWWAGTVERRVTNTKRWYEDQNRAFRGFEKLTDKDSLEERIFSATGKYHEMPLWRLISAANEVKGQGTITQRAFVIRLNRQKKELHRNNTPPR
jgi:hypothetical protein